MMVFMLFAINTYAQKTQVAVLKYKGGGDWYSNPTSLPNLVKFCNQMIKTDIDVNVLIRPREGGFLYNAEEIDAMCRDIALCRELGFHGVVIGALTADGDVDVEACRRMMAAAGDMSVTFHRAFDVCRNPQKALEDIISLGCHRLLSSGQQTSAELGAELLAELVEQADGRIIVMPGAGIRPTNIALIEQKTGAAEFHSTARVTKSDGMNFTHPRVSFATSPADEGRISLSDRAIVSQLVNNSL